MAGGIGVGTMGSHDVCYWAFLPRPDVQGAMAGDAYREWRQQPQPGTDAGHGTKDRAARKFVGDAEAGRSRPP